MFQHIMVPVDLAHMDTLEPALGVVADMARHYDANITYVGITTGTPSSVARTPGEYEQKLEAFAQQRHSVHGRPVTAKVYQSPDPIANMDDLLVDAVDDTNADLVIMATHLPRSLDAIIPANGDKVAARTSSSIFLVRAPQDK
ncbi:universal stress protein [Vreelandella jeotgali]|uniref:universal stress protein n=1 Tax=Vreelandella jeotgali TaxID=553386 RepID=UPI00034D8FBA|nr:universal stress protein [Halomonas jeotgali]